jgi:hypothetical protein
MSTTAVPDRTKVGDMKKLVSFLCRDERGCLLMTEWVLVAMVLTLGAVAGLIAARDAVLGPVENAPVVSSR